MKLTNLKKTLKFILKNIIIVFIINYLLRIFYSFANKQLRFYVKPLPQLLICQKEFKKCFLRIQALSWIYVINKIKNYLIIFIDNYLNKISFVINLYVRIKIFNLMIPFYDSTTAKYKYDDKTCNKFNLKMVMDFGYICIKVIP